MTNRLKVFAEKYTDPLSPTFLNGTQSMIASGHSPNQDSAAVAASRALRKDNVLSYIEQLNADNGIGVEERSKLVALTLTGKTPHETMTDYLDADGNVTGSTRVSKAITPDQVAKLIDLANRTEGVYNKAQVAEHVAKREYDARITELRAEVVARGRGRGAKSPPAQ